MRYRVEYLSEIAREASVCHTAEAGADLEVVAILARVGGVQAKREHGASGFHIRDLNDNGRIVAFETLDEASIRFLPTGNEVIH